MSKALTFSLTTAQRERLQSLIHAGSVPARTQKRVRILLLADRSQRPRLTDARVAEAVLCSPTTVGNIRRRFVRESLEATLEDKPLPVCEKV